MKLHEKPLSTETGEIALQIIAVIKSRSLYLQSANQYSSKPEASQKYRDNDVI